MTQSSGQLHDVGLVAIGRNEGPRLRACLESVVGSVARVVYVDSGSADDSIAIAESLGASVVRLDISKPFTAARARNEGFARLMQLAPDLTFVQFVDGDCQVVPGWLNTARSALAANPTLAAVCGRRRERFPEASIYNRLIDLEWNTPVGLCKSVGGDAMFRIAAFNHAGGFNPTVMAGEEPELCLRLRHMQWTLQRLDTEMTLHDAAMLHLCQWWRRQVRTGFGALDVYRRFEIDGERLFGKPTRSARVWALIVPLLAILLAVVFAAEHHAFVGIFLALFILLLIPLQAIRIATRAARKGYALQHAVAYGVLMMLSKFAFLLGQAQYYLDRISGRRGRLIEYKQSRAVAEVAP